MNACTPHLLRQVVSIKLSVKNCSRVCFVTHVYYDIPKRHFLCFVNVSDTIIRDKNKVLHGSVNQYWPTWSANMQLKICRGSVFAKQNISTQEPKRLFFYFNFTYVFWEKSIHFHLHANITKHYRVKLNGHHKHTRNTLCIHVERHIVSKIIIFIVSVTSPRLLAITVYLTKWKFPIIMLYGCNEL